MKKTTFLIIALITLISVGCGQASDRSANSDNSEIEGPVLNNIPSGKYELFSILNAVYEANPNAFDNQVKTKEFEDMLRATLNSRAKKNPNLLTEFPATLFTYNSHELKDGSFKVRFDYFLTNLDYPEMANCGIINYSIYTILSRETYSKMKTGHYIIKGIYRGFLENSKLMDNQHSKFSTNVFQSEDDKFFANLLGVFYYEDVTVNFVGDL